MKSEVIKTKVNT